jgi:protein TonB
MLFVVLPSLGGRTPPALPEVINLDFVAWQPPAKPQAKKPIVKKKQSKPKPKPKPKKVEAPKPIEPPPRQEPTLAESVEPAKQQPLAEPVEEVIEQVAVEVLPQPVPIFQVTSLPRVVHWEQPEYPQQMKMLGREATVKVEVLIDSAGKVRQAVVIKSGGSVFDAAAVSAIERSSFQPANIDGRAVPVRYRIPIRFRLS